MKSRWLLFLVSLTTLLGSCGSSDGLCGDNAGESHVGVDAAAIPLDRFELRICVNDLCNEIGTSSVGITYAPGEHPDFAEWTIDRLDLAQGVNWESLAGGRVDLSCSSDPTSVVIEVDTEGNPTISRVSP